MFAISFDLIVEELNKSHPDRVPRAYDTIRKTLARHGFVWTQGSVYVGVDAGLIQLFDAMNALQELSWFGQAVRQIRAFRMENNSDFTSKFKR